MSYFLLLIFVIMVKIFLNIINFALFTKHKIIKFYQVTKYKKLELFIQDTFYGIMVLVKENLENQLN